MRSDCRIDAPQHGLGSPAGVEREHLSSHQVGDAATNDGCRLQPPSADRTEDFGLRPQHRRRMRNASGLCQSIKFTDEAEIIDPARIQVRCTAPRPIRVVVQARDIEGPPLHLLDNIENLGCGRKPLVVQPERSQHGVKLPLAPDIARDGGKHAQRLRRPGHETAKALIKKTSGPDLDWSFAVAAPDEIDVRRHPSGRPLGGEFAIKRLSDAAQRSQLGLDSTAPPAPPRSSGYAGVSQNRGHLDIGRLGAVLDVYDLLVDNHARIVCTGALFVKHQCACVNAATVHGCVHSVPHGG